MKKIKTTNPKNIETIIILKKQSKLENSKIWKTIAKNLVKSHRKSIAINLSRLNRSTGDNETVVVPGKVLGSGQINHSLNVTALLFSNKAKKKIEAAKGKCLSFSDLIKENPKGSNIKIVG